jgi:O-antigen/teichoic acid export membrane protein
MSLQIIAFNGIKWTSASTFGRSLFQLLQVAILTRFLPKEDFGLVAMAMFVINFSNIFTDMGLSSAILHRQNATINEYSSIYWLNILVSVFLYMGLFFSAGVVSSFYNQPSLNILIPVLGMNILFLAIGKQHRTIMQKQLKFKAIALIELISYFTGLVLAIILVLNDFGIYSLVFSTLISSLISGLLFLFVNLRTNPIQFYFRIRETIPFLKIGIFSAGSSMLDFFSREIDILVIGRMLGAENLGIYSLTKQIVTKLYLLINPVVINVLSPLLSSIQTQKERLRLTYLKLVKYLSYINFTLFIMVIIASREILQVIYGTEYSDAYPVLSFLALSYSVIAVSNPVGSLQIATGRTDIGFKWTIVRVLITPIFILWGSLYNITAVSAIFALLTIILIIPLWYMQLRPMANISLLTYLNQFIKPFLFLLAVTITIYLGDIRMLSNNAMISGIIKAALGLMAFSSYLLVFDRKPVTEFLNFLLISLKR